ncbi:MAG: NACHT domain-containing protein, partial [Cyanobacteria bacterium SBLK]|nr:NACHT domain-containing protein [Cyanobacteria bacterium SBLK]
MIEWLAIWGVTQATGFAFKSLMEELATGAAKDYTKDFFKDCIGKVVRSPNQDPLKVACGKAIKAFLQLVQEELEDKEYSEAQVKQYEDPLKALIAHPDVMTALRSPFDPDCRIVETRVLVETWAELKLRFLPEDFDWDTLGKNYGKAVRKILRESEELRSLFEEQRAEEMAAGIADLRGIQPDADLGRYGEGLREFYGGLRLDSLDTTGAYYSEMKLWQVFVPQNVRECREFLPKTYEIPKEHIRLLQERGELDEIELAEEVFERSRRTYAEQPLASVFEIVGHPQQPEKRAEVQYAVILGDPGSGKSTLLQYIALTWAKRPLRDLPRYPIPLAIELRTYARNKRDGKCKDILSFIHSGEIVNRLNQQYLHEQLKRGHAIALLDGLDEVFDPQLRDEVVTDIHRFTNDYKLVPAIVTSRWLGYKAQRLRDAEFRHFMLQDFDEKQIATFIEKWHDLTFSAAVQGERWRKQERLERAIANSKAIRELAVNPLLLTMMAILNRNRELPKDRPELYNKASEVLLYQWDAERKLIQQHVDLKAIDYRDKQGMLREVAYRMQGSEKGLAGNVINGDDLEAILRDYLTQNTDADKPRMVSRLLIQQLRTRNFILCDLGANFYAFVHRTFLEYFCARAFVWRFEKAQILTLEDLKTEVFGKHWDDESWHEVLRLIAGMIESRFAGEVIEFLLQQDGEDAQFANVFLAAECLLEVKNRAEIQECDRSVLPEVQALISFDLKYYYGGFVWTPENESNDSMVVCGEWLVGPTEQIREIRTRAIKIVAEVWQEDKTTKNWLKTRALFDEDSDVRQAAVQELARGWKDNPNTLPWLKTRALSDENEDVRQAAVQELARGWKD